MVLMELKCHSCNVDARFEDSTVQVVARLRKFEKNAYKCLINEGFQTFCASAPSRFGEKLAGYSQH